MSKDYTLMSGTVTRTTDAAVLFQPETRIDAPVWLPRSACFEGEHIETGATDIEVENWKLEQEGLIN